MGKPHDQFPVLVPRYDDTWTDRDHTVYRLRREGRSWSDIERIINSRETGNTYPDGRREVEELDRDDPEWVPFLQLRYHFEARMRNLPPMEDTAIAKRELLDRIDERRSRLTRHATARDAEMSDRLRAEEQLTRLDHLEANTLGLFAAKKLHVEVSAPTFEEMEERLTDFVIARGKAVEEATIVEATTVEKPKARKAKPRKASK